MRKTVLNFTVGLLGGLTAYGLINYFKKEEPKTYIVEKIAPVSNKHVQLADYSFSNQVNTKLDFTLAAEYSKFSCTH